MTLDSKCTMALSELVLDELNPEESPLVEVVGQQLLRAGVRHRVDGALGMGIEEFAWIAVVLPASDAVIDYLVEQAKEHAKTEVTAATKAVLAWLRARGGNKQLNAASDAKPHEASDDADSEGAALPVELMKRVRDVACRQSLAAGVDEARAGLIADAIVGALGTSHP